MFVQSRLFVILSLSLSWNAWSFAAESAAKKVDFGHDVVPILKARCAECHTNGKYKGSLSLDHARNSSRPKWSCRARAATASWSTASRARIPTNACRPRGTAVGQGDRAAQGVDRPGAAVGSGLHLQADHLRRAALKPPGRAAAAARAANTPSTGSSRPIDAAQGGPSAAASTTSRLPAASTST